MKKTRLIAGVAVVGAVGFAMVAGCGGGGGGGSSAKTAKFTLADTQAAVDDVTVNVDGCNQPARQAVAMAKKTSKALGATSFARIPLYRVQEEGLHYGDCTSNPDGQINVEWADHSSGNTYFNVTFTNYCSRDPVSGNETILNGAGEYIWDGDSTDSGNLIRAEKMSTDASGLRAVTYNSSSAIIADTTSVLTGYTRTRGTPNYRLGGLWSPVAPTEADPDTETITKLKVTDNLTDEVSTFTSLKGKVYDSAGDHILTVTGGSGSSTVVGSYSIATETGSPIVFRNKEYVAGGTLVITGSNSTVKISATADANNDFNVSVKGSDTGGVFVDVPLDCGGVDFDYYFYGVND